MKYKVSCVLNYIPDPESNDSFQTEHEDVIVNASDEEEAKKESKKEVLKRYKNDGKGHWEAEIGHVEVIK